MAEPPKDGVFRFDRRDSYRIVRGFLNSRNHVVGGRLDKLSYFTTNLPGLECLGTTRSDVGDDDLLGYIAASEAN